MPRRQILRACTAALAATGAAPAVGGLGVPAAQAATPAARCTAYDFVVARGTFEPGTLGIIVGDPVNAEIAKQVTGVTGTPLDYPANTDATSPATGTKALVGYLTVQAAACPNQRFILSGYSQGAELVDSALGIDTTGAINGGPPAAVIPASVEPRIAAIVLFGNPIGSLGKHVTGTYAARTKDFCADGDPVCQPDAINIFAHLSYFLNATDAATFVAHTV